MSLHTVCCMQGEKLDDGCSEVDYRIKVGHGNCSVVDFTTNEITCEPPADKPPVDVTRVALCHNSTTALALVVSIPSLLIVS